MSHANRQRKREGRIAQEMLTAMMPRFHAEAIAEDRKRTRHTTARPFYPKRRARMAGK